MADSVGETAISAAIKAGNVEMVRYLAESGADIEHREV